MSDAPPPLPVPPEADTSARLPARLAISLALALSFAVFLAYILAGLVAVKLLAPDAPRVQILIAQAVGLLAPGLAILVFLRRLGIASRPPTPARARLPRDLAAVLGAALCGSVFAQAGHALWAAWLHGRGWAWVAWAERQAAEAYGPLLDVSQPSDVLLILLVATLTPAVCEELVFRRILQGVLSASLAGGVAAALAAAIFSAFHLDPIGLPGRFLIGLSIGLVYHRTGSLLAAGLLHAVHNGIAVTLALGAGAEFDPAQIGRMPFVAWIVIASVGLLAFIGWLLSLAALPSRAPPPPRPPDPPDPPAWRGDLDPRPGPTAP